MLITMKDGGLKEYSDDTQCYPGCETCDQSMNSFSVFS